MENTYLQSDDPTSVQQEVAIHHHEEAHEPVNGGLSNGFYVISFLILMAILIAFGDMLIFILGILGMIAFYASYFTGQDEQEAARH